MKSEKIIAAIVAAVGLLALGLCIKSGLNSFANRDRVVTVRGLCEKEYAANKVTWPIVTKETGNSLPAIYERIEHNNEVILNFLRAAGIPESEITVAPPSVVDLESREYVSSDRVARYIVTNVVVVTSPQVDKVRQLMSNLTELLKQGIAVQADNYEYQTIYEYTDLNAIKPAMIAEATEAARQAANKFAEDSGCSIGALRSATQGQFTINDRDQFTPYIKTIRVVSTLTYALED